MSFLDEEKNSDFIRNYKRFQEQFNNLYWKKQPDWYLTFKEHDDEEFKPIDEYQGFYYISNYGKVISFKRKLPAIRRPSMMSGLLAVTLNHFGSTKLHYIHELVYFHFIGKIEPYHRIVHKDKNPANNYYKNLEKISISDLLEQGGAAAETDSSLLPGETKSPEKSQKTLKTKMSVKPRQTKRPLKPKQTRKPWTIWDEFDAGVLQFTEAGDFVQEHFSFHEAGNHAGVEPDAILNCLKGETRTAGGYQWRYSVDPNFDEGIFAIPPVPGTTRLKKPAGRKETPAAKPGKSRSKSIGQYDGTGHLIRVYPSIKEAAQEMGITPAAISFSMQKTTRTAAGFTWKLVT